MAANANAERNTQNNDNNNGNGSATEQDDDSDSTIISRGEYDRQKRRADRLDALSRDLEVKLRKFEGIDPEEVKALREELNNLQKDKEKAAPNNEEAEKRWNNKIAEINRQWGEKVSGLESRVNGYEKELKGLKIVDKVYTAISGNFVDGSARHLRREIEAAADMEDGEIVFKDESGEVLYNKRGVPRNVEEFSEYLQEQFPYMARATAAGGAKDTKEQTKRAGNGNPGGVKPRTLEELNRLPNAQAVYNSMSQEEKQELYRQMKAAERSQSKSIFGK